MKMVVLGIFWLTLLSCVSSCRVEAEAGQATHTLVRGDGQGEPQSGREGQDPTCSP